jgi:hypothetical protein
MTAAERAKPAEPNITINSVPLTPAEAMTVRVALNAFAIDLRSADSLGDDDHGHAMRDGYLAALRDIFALMPAAP